MLNKTIKIGIFKFKRKWKLINLKVYMQGASAIIWERINKRLTCYNKETKSEHGAKPLD